jgi:hypothetical protein
VAWKPPIDPATGEVVWDATPPADKPPAKGRSWRKGAKSGAVAAAGAASAAAMADRASSDAAPAPAPAPSTPAASPAPAGLDLGTSPFAGDPPPTVTPPGSVVAATGGRPPKAKRSNRSTVGVLVVVLVIVLAAIGYFAYKKSNDNSTTTTAATVPPPSPAAAATVLAAYINLRISDLPPGWSAAPSTGQPARPPVAPAAIQARANQALAGCLGRSGQAVAGLFAGATLPGQVGAAKSPTFQTGADPDVTMYSTSAVLVSTAAVQALAVPFTNASFTTCYGQYQTSLAAAVVPGATAQVQPVTLDAPAGVKAYGYLTTLTLPNQGSEVVGQAFLLGGRIVTLLEPSTNGPSIPSAPFTSAFNAVAGRMAASVDK